MGRAQKTTRCRQDPWPGGGRIAWLPKVAIGFAVAVAAGCDAGTSGALVDPGEDRLLMGPEEGPDAAEDVLSPFDSRSEEDLAEPEGDVWAQDEGPTEVQGPEDVESGECDPPAAIGCPCSKNTDCLGGVCVLTDEGYLCSATCKAKDLSCLLTTGDWCDLPGWALQKVSSPLFGTLWYCLPLHPRLCRPCRTDEDCDSWAEAVCLDYGPSGRFCGTRCNDIVSCPKGYVCEEVSGHAGLERACRLAEGECECSPMATADGASTVCYVMLGLEPRLGERRCSEEGLTACGVEGGAPEVCNGLDDDLDGLVDEEGAQGCAFWFRDEDGDGFGTGPGACRCGPSDDFSAVNNADCDDSDALVHPGALEVCNGRDDDCDGEADREGLQGCTTYYWDADGDGYGVALDSKCLCAPSGSYQATQAGDCDDSKGSVHPGAVEACNGQDDDCNGQADGEGVQGCKTYYKDGDGDGYGVAQDSKCLCAASGAYQAGKAGDCNDSNAAVHPGAKEVCNGVDDDCDGVKDPPGTCQVAPTKKVCLDPGHGGSDPGAVGYVVEKDVNLDIVLRFRDLLKQDTANQAGGGSWQVFLTRDKDVYVSLEARVAYANNNQVDRFMSTHNNACGYCGGNGTETYWYTQGSAQSQDLATRVQKQVVAHLGTKDRGVKQANFYVLKYTNMPAILLEGAFVDHQGDAAKLADPGMRQEIARGQLHGLQIHFGYTEFDP